MEINSSNFQEIINSETPVLVKFSVRSGCKFCDQFKPLFDSFSESSGIPCYEYTKEDLKTPNDEVMNKYAVTSFPTTIAFQKGKKLNKQVGILEEEKLIALTKTLQNISDIELEKLRLKVNTEINNINIALLEAQEYLGNVNAECVHRMTPPKEQKPTEDNEKNPRSAVEKPELWQETKSVENTPVIDFKLPERTVDEAILKPCEWWCQ